MRANEGELLEKAKILVVKAPIKSSAAINSLSRLNFLSERSKSLSPL